MISERQKTCIQCNTHFETVDKRKVYCSNGCKQNAFRERHGVSTPEFLQPRTTKGLMTKTRRVSTKVPNPEYREVEQKVNQASWNLDNIETTRLHLVEEQAKLLNQDDALLNGLSVGALSIGTALGIAVVGVILANATKDKNDKKRILLVTAIVALSAAVLAAIANHSQIKDERQQRKLKRLEKLKVKSDKLEVDYINAAAELATYKAQLSITPENVAQDESYTETPYDSSQRVISLVELQSKNFQSLTLSSEYRDLIGEPERNFAMAVHGSPGNGKSTFAADLANDLAVHGSQVLYIAAEEGFSKSMQRKLINFQSVNFFVSNCRNVTSVKDALKHGKYGAIVIDSVQQIGIKPAQLNNLRALYPETSFIYILQSTKAGSFKGDNQYAHDADVIVKLEKYSPIVEKTRFK